MKPFIKRALHACGYSLQRLPKGVVTGTDLARDLRLVVGSASAPYCIDAGANHGDMISLMHRCLISPRVHAFEPNPASFAALQINHRATPNTRLNHAGLGDIAGTLSLQLLENHALDSFLPLSTSGRARLDANDAPKTAAVPVLRLDDYCGANALQTVDLLKVDTQGFELHVLRGAQTLFAERRVRTVLIELNFDDLYVGQAKPHEVISLLTSHGLRLVDFYEKCRHQPLLGWCTALFARGNNATDA